MAKTPRTALLDILEVLRTSQFSQFAEYNEDADEPIVSVSQSLVHLKKRQCRDLAAFVMNELKATNIKREAAAEPNPILFSFTFEDDTFFVGIFTNYEGDNAGMRGGVYITKGAK